MLEQERANQSKAVGYAAALLIFLGAIAWTFLANR